jgi:hypothetical protein
MERAAMRRAGLKAICVAVPKSLLMEARHVALDQGVSLRSLVSDGLAHIVTQRKGRTEPARPAGVELVTKT